MESVAGHRTVPRLGMGINVGEAIQVEKIWKYKLGKQPEVVHISTLQQPPSWLGFSPIPARGG